MASELQVNTIQPASGQALTIKDEGGTASITVATNGEATFAENIIVGTSGKGINFSATSDGSGASNVNEILSDYEQGTFTPLLKGVNGDPSYGGSAQARYTRVGNVVHFNVLIDVNPYSSDGSGQIFIKGFPFNFVSADAGVAPAISVSLWGPSIGSGKMIVGAGIGADNSMKFKIWGSGASQTFWDYSTASISGGNAIYVQGHYYAS